MLLSCEKSDVAKLMWLAAHHGVSSILGVSLLARLQMTMTDRGERGEQREGQWE